MISRDRKEKMIHLVEQWKLSGQSQKSFALAQGIKPHTFRYWVQKQQKHTGNSGEAFIELALHPSDCINIRYPNGIELQLPAATPLSGLKALLSL